MRIWILGFDGSFPHSGGHSGSVGHSGGAGHSGFAGTPSTFPSSPGFQGKLKETQENFKNFQRYFVF